MKEPETPSGWSFIAFAMVIFASVALGAAAWNVIQKQAHYEHDTVKQLVLLKDCMAAHSGVDVSRLDRITAGPDVDKYCEAFAEQNSRLAKP